MATIVSLRMVADEIDSCPQECQAFLNRKTGECFTVIDEDENFAPNEPEWQMENAAKTKEVLESDDWIELPNQRDFQEYRVMQSFCESVSDREIQASLCSAIAGAGAFRRFKETVYRANMADQWHQFRDEKLQNFVASWLDSQGFTYENKF